MPLNTKQLTSLKPYNTFGIEVNALRFSTIKSLEQLTTTIKENEQHQLPYFILGGGSNMLLLEDVAAWVIKNECLGIRTIKEDEDHVWLAVGGGEVWHDFVMYCVENNYSGIENLALIPGTVGAAPIQNIGAYGVEVKEVIESVNAFDLSTATTVSFNNTECEFGYRESIFKSKFKNKLFIYEVVFKLHKKEQHKITYGDISKTLTALALQPSTLNIATAVIHIRQSKLPDPKILGNSGSFFKNPEISKDFYEELVTKHPNIPGYNMPSNTIKVPAGWLIEQAGWKGYKAGNCGVHTHQALVLVNYGGASGEEIFKLSQQIIDDVQLKYGITLIREVQVYPSDIKL